MSNRRVAMGLGLALLSASAFVSTAAQADAVSPPPERCPDGTTPATGHCGPHCEPKTCTTNADCTEGTCMELDYCTTTIVCAGLVGPDEDLSQYERTSVFERCPASGNCSQGSCSTLKLCATGAAPNGPTPDANPPSPNGDPATIDTGVMKNPVDDSPSDSGGCSVSAPGRHRSYALLLPLLALLLPLRRRS